MEWTRRNTSWPRRLRTVRGKLTAKTDKTDIVDVMSQWDAERKAEAKEAASELDKVLVFLRANGVKEIVVEYNGSGDSGSLSSMVFITKDEKEINGWAAMSPTSLRVPIERYVYTQLPGGWEINEGSSGTVTINVDTGETELDHNWNPEDTGDGQES